MIYQQLIEDMKLAMKARDNQKTQALRFLVSACKQIEVDERRELSDQDLIKILKSELKKRQEAWEIYKKAGRQDLADHEKFEIDLINSYLPAQMPKEEIEIIVTQVIGQLGKETNFGQIMKSVLEKTAGQADGKLVSEIVRQKLA